MKEMDQLMSAYSIVDSEEEICNIFEKGRMKMDDKEETVPTIIMCKK
jgi:hypothetical protein